MHLLQYAAQVRLMQQAAMRLSAETVLKVQTAELFLKIPIITTLTGATAVKAVTVVTAAAVPVRASAVKAVWAAKAVTAAQGSTHMQIPLRTHPVWQAATVQPVLWVPAAAKSRYIKPWIIRSPAAVLQQPPRPVAGKVTEILVNGTLLTSVRAVAAAVPAETVSPVLTSARAVQAAQAVAAAVRVLSSIGAFPKISTLAKAPVKAAKAVTVTVTAVMTDLVP